MNAFIYSTILQWKIDFRNKNVLLTYYIVPLIFYFVMGSVFSTINPLAKETLIQSMTIFAVSMAAFFGTPTSLVELFTTEAKKAYKVGNIPLWTMILTNFISALVHILAVSLIIYLSAPVVFKADYPSYPVTYFLCLVLFILVSTGIGILIGLITKKASTLPIMAQLVFLPSLLLSGIMFPSDMLPRFFVLVSNVFPSTHAMRIFTATTGVKLGLLMPLIAVGFVITTSIVVLYKSASNNS